MTYAVEDKVILFEIDRRQITDIMPGDVLRANDFPQGQYTWTEQDAQFVENNPEACVFLRLQKADGETYEGRILLLPEGQ